MGDPFFEGGVPLVVDRKGAGDAAIGDLVVLRLGRGARGSSGCSARPTRSRRCSRGCSGTSASDRPRRRFRPSPPGASDPERVDLRDLHALTIDPEGAKDFDDALSLRREGDGLRAWVHIADVAAYVPPGSPLDRDASERAFSVYVPGRSSRCSRSGCRPTCAACARTSIAAA